MADVPQEIRDLQAALADALEEHGAPEWYCTQMRHMVLCVGKCSTQGCAEKSYMQVSAGDTGKVRNLCKKHGDKWRRHADVAMCDGCGLCSYFEEEDV